MTEGPASTAHHFYYHRGTENTEAKILCALCASVVNQFGPRWNSPLPLTLKENPSWQPSNPSWQGSNLSRKVPNLDCNEYGWARCSGWETIYPEHREYLC